MPLVWGRGCLGCAHGERGGMGQFGIENALIFLTKATKLRTSRRPARHGCDSRGPCSSAPCQYRDPYMRKTRGSGVLTSWQGQTHSFLQHAAGRRLALGRWDGRPVPKQYADLVRRDWPLSVKLELPQARRRQVASSHKQGAAHLHRGGQFDPERAVRRSPIFCAVCRVSAHSHHSVMSLSACMCG